MRHALFDFDGTLSLLRAGWQEVMVAHFTEVLAEAAPATDVAEHESRCRAFITDLTGRQTIFQARELAERVRAAGVEADTPEAYKAEYLRRLHARIDHRLVALRQGTRPAADFLVPGSIELLQRLVDAGVTCHLASGTDRPNVVEEAELLGLTRFFTEPGDEPRIHGALPDVARFSKRMVIDALVTRHGLAGSQLAGFGDGFVEIEETRRAGGTAVGVASREDGSPGLDEWKAERLAGVGAHVLVPDWHEAPRLLALLGVTA